MAVPNTSRNGNLPLPTQPKQTVDRWPGVPARRCSSNRRGRRGRCASLADGVSTCSRTGPGLGAAGDDELRGCKPPPKAPPRRVALPIQACLVPNPETHQANTAIACRSACFRQSVCVVCGMLVAMVGFGSWEGVESRRGLCWAQRIVRGTSVLVVCSTQNSFLVPCPMPGCATSWRGCGGSGCRSCLKAYSGSIAAKLDAGTRAIGPRSIGARRTAFLSSATEWCVWCVCVRKARQNIVTYQLTEAQLLRQSRVHAVC